MTQKADAVIIGGGIVGASVAYHLVAGGLKDVVLLEKEPLLGMGSTAASAGVIFHHHPEKVNLQMSRSSLRALLEFEDEFDTKIDFRQSGSIKTAGTPEDLAELERIARELGRMGVVARMLQPAELREFFPRIVVEDLLGAIYTPDDGHFDPHGMLQGYAARARTLGARILTRMPATGVKTGRGKVAGVKTPQGDIYTEIVVNASGPMAAGVARLAGLPELPVVPFKRQIFITLPTDIVPPNAPFYFDKSPPLYFRPESSGLLMSIAEMDKGETRDLNVDWGSAAILAERATRRIPEMDSLELVRGWTGLRCMTPDHTAILGPLPGLAGFYCAVGFSDHGVMHAPVTGRIMASMVIDRNLNRHEDINLAPLRYERFLQKE